MFGERKYCQVSAYESETFHRRRSYGISHCENGEQNPPNVPFGLDYVDPHLIQQCLGPPQASAKTAARTVEALSHKYAVKSPLVTMVRSKFAPKSTPPADRLPNRNTCLIRGPVRPMVPNGCRLRSAVFAQCTGQTDRPTDRARESLMTIGRCAPRATRPNNNNNNDNNKND